MLKLSHISCRVEDLGAAAKEACKMGFRIEWGGMSGQANNFFIWFGEDAFLEVFSIKKRYKPMILFMLIAYGLIPSKKWWHWYNSHNKWCDFALEEDDEDKIIIEKKKNKTIIGIEDVKQELRNQNLIVSKKTLHWRRKNNRGIYANYSFFIPNNVSLPFIVSRYEPKQKPQFCSHPNGSKRIIGLVIAVKKEDWKEMRLLTRQDKRIILKKGEETEILEIQIAGLDHNYTFYGTNLVGGFENE